MLKTTDALHKASCQHQQEAIATEMHGLYSGNFTFVSLAFSTTTCHRKRAHACCSRSSPGVRCLPIPGIGALGQNAAAEVPKIINNCNYCNHAYFFHSADTNLLKQEGNRVVILAVITAHITSSVTISTTSMGSAAQLANCCRCPLNGIFPHSLFAVHKEHDF